MISSLGLHPTSLIASCNAEVPFIMAVEYFALVNLVIFSSNFFTNEPDPESQLDLIHCSKYFFHFHLKQGCLIEFYSFYIL